MMAAEQSVNRYHALDSLRGIAAFGVLLTHILQRLTPDGAFNHTPLRMLVNGRCFVVFFFVLSGFVLASAIWKASSRFDYRTYAVRRFLRLYPPFLAAGALGIIVAWAQFGGVDFRAAFDYALALGTSKGVEINAPSWSLVYELRLSLAMPLICYVTLRWPVQAGLALALLFVSEEALILFYRIGQFPYTAESLGASLIVTARFAVCFWVGAVLARDTGARNAVTGVLARRRTVMLLIALGLMSILLDQTSMVGAAIIILLALEWRALKNLLALRPFAWLGRMSYSLYLTHFIVIALVIDALPPRTSPYATFVVAIVAALVVGEVFYRLIERPSLELSRRAAWRAPLGSAPAPEALKI